MLFKVTIHQTPQMANSETHAIQLLDLNHKDKEKKKISGPSGKKDQITYKGTKLS